MLSYLNKVIVLARVEVMICIFISRAVFFRLIEYLFALTDHVREKLTRFLHLLIK